MKDLKKIAVFTSGGDSPGMNAAIRAVVRTARFHKIEIMGIMRGYEGMIDNDFINLKRSSVSNIIHRGGTFLMTARSMQFMTEEGMQKAYENVKSHQIEALVAIGGDGTFKGAKQFGDKYTIPIVGLPGTIDNDLVGTDFTIGYDTAINTVVDAVDKIRDTASSHNRIFFVEVMGRDAGLIALRSGIATGAESILIPETHTDIEELIAKLSKGYTREKNSHIIMVAEGDEFGGAQKVADIVKQRLPHLDARVSILGHMQRGGSPSCMDRVNASQMGFYAVEALLKGEKGVMIGIVNKHVKYTPFEQATKHIQKLYPDMMKMVEILSL